MSLIQPQLHEANTDVSEEEAVNTVHEVEAEIREFVRRDGRHLRRSQDTTGELFATNVNSLVQRVAGASLREIDELLRELESLRNTLQSEGERVQRELTNYAALSQAAMNSIRINAESMSQWRSQADQARTH
jgi:valyl-tRNA synthetase